MKNIDPARGDWMQTFTGRRFYFMTPDAADVDPTDIAHALSNICRFGGHTLHFYSVAEHCVALSHAVSPENALHALLHDATEAYVNDIVRPLKRYLPDYRAVERNVWLAIAARFNIDPDMSQEVFDADYQILVNERAKFMRRTTDCWPVDALPPLPLKEELEGHRPATAKILYLQRLLELFGPNLGQRDW